MEFKIGFEIHQRLDTHKLFCHCDSSTGVDEVGFIRRLRPVASETGGIDRAALFEYLSGRRIKYLAPREVSCLVEMDEEPPHELNDEALDIALQIAKIFNANPVEEVHPMRKIVIDGSNTTGFQRTMLIARDGWFDWKGKKITIPTIYLEEESAGIVGAEGDTRIYRLDRLGVPLVELSTGVIDGVDPDEAREIALRIGKLLRSTGRVKRGLGTIRQDVNISIPGGARVELKGVQDIDLLPEVIRREVSRQKKLIEVKKEIKRRKLKRVKLDPIDISSQFSSSKSKILRGKKVIMQVLPGFSGILGIEVQPGRRVGTEIADYAKKAGVKGIIHSDEDLSKYHIDPSELDVSRNDAFMLIAGKNAELAMELAVNRVNALFDGVLEEVRKVLPDGNSSYMRPMPGAARMYPETDVRPILISRDRWDAVSVPDPPEKVEKRLLSLGLSKDLASYLVNTGEFFLFDRIVSKTNADPVLVASTLANTVKALRREGFEIELSEEDWVTLFSSNIPKEALPDAILTFSKTKDPSSLERFKGLSEEEAREIIRRIISRKELQGKKFSVIMGEVMKELRGKLDGKLIAKIVREELG